MRNLKKFLALVMALVMAFSLMLSASAADQVKEWTDKDQVDAAFVEAVDVLSGMEIFQGDERGFAPGSTITRAETAALIYRLATGDVTDARAGLYANYGNFTDVKEGDWFAGYVGYCANAGYIKGTTPTTFNPYAPVTGYEALAMILRAVGYDKNGEFTGPTWQTNVSALGTRLKVLDKVKTTHYGNTLHLASRRDVVASILFESAQISTVTYTPALGYETNGVTDKSSDGLNGRSLGVVNFGLAKTEGIIVGNQDTGESMTRINKVKKDSDGNAVAPDYYAYFHQTKNFNVMDSNANSNADKAKAVVETTVSNTIDAKTGVEMFGHKVKAWYSTFPGNKTFALYDKVKKTALVTPVNNTTTNDTYDSTLAAGTNNLLGKAIQAAGFNVDLVNSRAVYNKDFGISGVRVATTSDTGPESVKDSSNNPLYVSDYTITGTRAKAGNPGGVISDSKLGSPGVANRVTNYPLYLVISNNDALTPDMIIAVNVNVSKVVQVNNYATHQTVTVPQVSYDGTASGFNTDATNRIAQGALTATSTKELGDGVVAIKIAGTKVSDHTIAINGNGYAKLNGYTQPANSPLANTGETSLYRLSKPTQVVEGLVTQYKGSSTAAANYGTNPGTVSHTGSITIDGKVIERSLLADAIVDYNEGAPNTTTAAQIKAVDLTATAQTYQKYRAYLDEEGKYIWVEPINERKFVYGTYLDYTTPYASSSYEYTMVYVDGNGETGTEVVKTFNGNPIGRDNYRAIGPITAAAVRPDPFPANYGVPYRDSSSVAGVTPNVYAGFSLGDNGDLLTNNLAGWKWAYGNGGAAGGNHPFGNPADTNKTTVITRTDARLGMVKTGGSNSASDEWYITESTKVIAVSGAGTDTQKVKVFNGITELLDGGTKLTISHGVNSTAKGPLMGGYAYGAMMYYKDSNFTYASNVSRAKQIDTLILPMDAMKWEGKSNLYFIGNNEKTSEIQVGTNWFTQFEMYLDGEKQSIWIDGKDNGTDAGGRDVSSKVIAANNAEDRFYELALTDKTLPDGTPVYTIANYVPNTTAGFALRATNEIDYVSGRPDIANSKAPVVWGGTYWAATYSAQTATINPTGTATTTNKGVSGFSTSAAAAGADVASYNVANAKVVNLNAPSSPLVNAAPNNTLGTNSFNTGYIWNGITDLGTLNDAASTASIYGYGRQPVVSFVVDPTNTLNVTVIYIHWNQNIALT